MSHQQRLSGLPRGVIARAHCRRVGIQRARKHKPSAAVIIMLLQLHIRIIRQPPSDIRPVFVPSHHLARWPREACTLLLFKMGSRGKNGRQLANDWTGRVSGPSVWETSRKQGGVVLCILRLVFPYFPCDG